MNRRWPVYTFVGREEERGMPTPVIAIVGSYDSKRIAELALEGTRDDAKQAGEALGTALANQGYQILVYDSSPSMLEVDVVRGYAVSKKAKPDSIHIHYSYKQAA